MGLSLVMSFLGIYVVDTRGYPAWVYGAIALVANLGQSISSAWAGALSDRVGRRPLIVTSLVVRAAVIAVLGTQILFEAPLWSLAVTMLVSTLLRGCFEPVAYALVADVVAPEQRIAAFGLQRMGTNLGWALGPALGGALTLAVPYGVVFYVAAAGVAAAAALCRGVVDPIAAGSAPRPPAPRGELRAALRDTARHPLGRWLLAGTLLAALLHTQMFSTLGIYMTERLDLTKADVGLIYAINGAAVLALQLPAVALVARLGLGAALPWASILSTAGFAAVGAAAGLDGVILAMLAITCGEVLFTPAHQTAIAEAADPAHRGRAYGIYGFAQMVGIALAPLLGGILLDAIGDRHAATWLALATLGVAQAACFWAYVRRRARARIAADDAAAAPAPGPEPA
jgi:MFS family permease